MIFFFFQAEDGIRDGHVTGVQTCALPIFLARWFAGGVQPAAREPARQDSDKCQRDEDAPEPAESDERLQPVKIGRASCRERVESSEVTVALKKNKRIKSSCKQRCRSDNKQ